MSILHLREAILERMAIMANKILLAEVLEDLRNLSQVSDVSPFSEREYLLIRRMIVDPPYYGNDSIFEKAKFFVAIRKLSPSKVIRLLRSKIAYALLARCKKSPSVHNFSKSLRYLSCMYLV
jgi:hypothetical protein